MRLKNYRDLRVKHRQNLLSFNDKSKIIWGAWAPLLTPDPPKIVPTITTSVAPPPKIVTAKSTTTTTPWPVIKIITAKNTTPWPVIIGLPACKYFSFFSDFWIGNGNKCWVKCSSRFLENSAMGCSSFLFAEPAFGRVRNLEFLEGIWKKFKQGQNSTLQLETSSISKFILVFGFYPTLNNRKSQALFGLFFVGLRKKPTSLLIHPTLYLLGAYLYITYIESTP